MSVSRSNMVGFAFVAAVFMGLGGFVGYRMAAHRSEFQNAGARTAAPGPSADRPVLYWYDPMQPTQHFEKPGKSPFMDMQLIPKYADEPAGARNSGIQIDPGLVQSVGIRFTTVQKGPLPQTIDAVGTLGFNERHVAIIQARSNGFVTRIYARAPGDVIEANAPIVDLLFPEWTGAQTEFIALLDSGDQQLIGAARQRLTLLGMPPELIDQVERSRKPTGSVTVRSPIAGVIETLDSREGMTAAAGATLAKIVGLGTVWLEAAIPEARGGAIAAGRSIKARFIAYPGESFPGRVIAVLPQANMETRTLRVRIEIPNSDHRLKPGMFAQVRLDTGSVEPVLHVASEAIIRTGTRTVAIVEGQDRRFIATAVQTGIESDGKTEILAGLTEGQRVVASGQFLIDSEASLRGVLARLGASDPGSAGAMQETHHD